MGKRREHFGKKDKKPKRKAKRLQEPRIRWPPEGRRNGKEPIDEKRKKLKESNKS